MTTDRHLFLVPPLGEKPARPRPTRSLSTRPWRVQAAIDTASVDDMLKPVLLVTFASRDPRARGRVVLHARTAREAFDILAWINDCFAWFRLTDGPTRSRRDTLGSGVLHALRAHGLTLDAIAAGLAAALEADPHSAGHHLDSSWCARPTDLARLGGEADSAYADRLADTDGCLHWWTTAFPAALYAEDHGPGVRHTQATSVPMKFADVTRTMCDRLGSSLVSHAGGATDRHAAGQWSQPDAEVQRPVLDRILTLHRLWCIVADAQGDHAARAWLIRGNDLLDGFTPLEAIRDDHHAQAVRAACTFADPVEAQAQD